MPTLFLLATLGEFLEANMFSISSLILVAIGGIIWSVRLEGRVNTMSEKLAKQAETIKEFEADLEVACKDCRTHAADSDKHVNHLHMRSMERRLDTVDSRIDKMEITMTNGFEKTMNRLDTLIRREV